MRLTSRASVLLLALLTGAAGAQELSVAVRPQPAPATTAPATSNMPSGSGEASTMTNGVPNLLASNPQPGELGIQSRLSVRPAAHTAQAARSASSLAVMGASGAAPSVEPATRD